MDARFKAYDVLILHKQVHDFVTFNGKIRLTYRKLVNSSFANLQKPQVELDGKACAAAGQNSLMALYDALFSQLDVMSSQLLVTDNDFKNADYRVQLGQIVNSLIALRSIPIFNENDAISTRTAPYEVLKRPLQSDKGVEDVCIG
nr:PREDICTED: delta-1-pyrroline-5-carboxylate synthase-like [Daucus carota subsp. sativus]